ncbi:MAG: hypothetical protein LQ338_001884 [Usnochroma carphineum]|nr:MAG: hypothetical protein LQ338_001884 [Usnochroma carphineum]
MSSSGVLRFSRTITYSAVPRHSNQGYCWSSRHRWSVDTYPKSLRYSDSGNKSCGADVDRLPYRRAGNALSGFTYWSLPRAEWRSSSSWAKWKSQWNDFERNQISKAKKVEEYSAAWDRQIEKWEKDTADIYRLLKERIEADPFDALFGRRFLHPNRATVRDNGEEKPMAGTKRESETKQSQATGTNGERQHHKDFSTSDSGTASQTKAPSSSATYDGNAVIDLITMRRTPQKSTSKSSESPVPQNDAHKSFDIPVKRFGAAKPQQPTPTSIEDEAAHGSSTGTNQAAETRSRNMQGSSKQDWLTQEGFGSRGKDVSRPETSETDATLTARQDPLDGLGRTSVRRSPDAISRNLSSSVSYNPEENRTEDIDLLRASDVRASSGLCGRPKREKETDRRMRRERLETRFDENLKKFRQLESDLQDSALWLATIKKQRKEAEATKAYEAYTAKHEREISAYKAAMEAMQTRQTEVPTISVDSTLIQPEQAEGDMASNVHEFASRERWYKRKAPHAAGPEEKKAVQVAKDRAFVREIRDIYEGTYGTIDTKHRQPKAAADNVQEQQHDPDTASSPPLSQEQNCSKEDEGQEKVPPPSGSLSSQEKIGTMLLQLLDDSRYMQKLLGKPELSGTAREELFHRNQSMRNASDAIAEALTPTSKQNNSPPAQVARLKSQSEVSNIQGLPKSEPQPLETKRLSTVYSVLAYDPSIGQVTTAEMTSPSDSPSERRLSLSEALSSVTEPAKFLPHLTTLQSQGYEIVSSDTNILVLRKTHKAPPPSSATSPITDVRAAVEQKDRRKSINPVDGTTTQTGNFASPTGFVNHDSPLPPEAFESEGAEQNPSGHTVRRKEDVFSGPSGKRWENKHHRHVGEAMRRRARYRRAARGNRTTKRMIWVGLWTAGCCYAVGAITELLRA